MSTVVMYDEADDYKGGWEASKVKCDVCCHTWWATRAEGAEALECLNCGRNGSFEELGIGEED